MKRVEIVPLEVIVRNISAGHFAQNYGVEEGIVFDEPTIGCIRWTCARCWGCFKPSWKAAPPSS